MFRARLDRTINVKHELVLLADKVDWTAYLERNRYEVPRL